MSCGSHRHLMVDNIFITSMVRFMVICAIGSSVATGINKLNEVNIHIIVILNGLGQYHQWYILIPFPPAQQWMALQIYRTQP